MSKSKPNAGDKVVFLDLNSEVVRGTVIDVLAAQFTVAHDGTVSYVFFTDDWSYDDA